jgi:hypothetical protein
MSDFETQIVDISEDALNDLFNETPTNTVNADTLVGGKKSEEKTETKDEKKANTKTEIPTNQLEEFDIEEFNDNEEEKQPKKEQKQAEVEEEEEEEDEEKEEEDKKAKKKPAAQKKDNEPQTDPEVTSVLKSTVDYLIEQGIWQDFDGREDLEITEEIYAKLAAKQDQFRVQNMFEEMIDRTGPFGKAIIDFVTNGGNPDEIIDLFKEQKQVESISIDNVEGQKDMIRSYYSDVLGWKTEKIEKFINSRLVEDELESEAKEAKELFGNYYKKEAERLTKEQEGFIKQQKEAEQAFEQNIKSAIKERKDLHPNEKKSVEEYLLNYDQRLPNGNMVNKFYINFAQMQQNPQDYIDLVMFVMDKNRFVQKLQTQEKNKATEQAFKFIKGNGAVSTKKGTTYESVKKQEKVSSFDWGLPKKQ